MNTWQSPGYAEMGELYSPDLSVRINLAYLAEKRSLPLWYHLLSQLRDRIQLNNMVVRYENMVQRPSDALVRGVDSVLIDEARTPLWSFLVNDLWYESAPIPHNGAYVKTLTEDDYIIDIPSRNQWFVWFWVLTRQATLISLYDIENVALTLLSTMPFVQTTSWFWISICGYEDQEILIVDQFTGPDHGRTSLFDGLHKRSKPKKVFQFKKKLKHLHRLLTKPLPYVKVVRGWQGQKTEEEEFREIYNIRVIPIQQQNPITYYWSSRPSASLKSKFQAVVEDVKSRHEKVKLNYRRYICRWTKWCFLNCWFKQCSSWSFECEKPLKRKLSWTRWST